MVPKCLIMKVTLENLSNRRALLSAAARVERECNAGALGESTNRTAIHDAPRDGFAYKDFNSILDSN